ncbi:A24 family peptidase [Jiella sonneratiae]|uniref:Prepilin peptidase n=1 Tax=Jiella sonneratiae TaxID=2816856 RepID=A0ABS3J8G2_9HYPH|nr:prepilin peptidase [Jiella sonneratiae]MBO0905954.1 prepilin peptidase [Jiella sonneratiae]
MLATTLFLTVFPFAMIYSALTDLLEMKIENRAMIVLAAAFLPAAYLAGLPWPVVGMHLLTGFLCLCVTFGMFAAGWMGGGDAKLIAATALWFGPTMLAAEYLLVSALVGGGLTLTILVLRSHLLPVTGVAFVDRLMEKDTGVPYGIALGVAGLYVYSHSFWLAAALG